MATPFMEKALIISLNFIGFFLLKTIDYIKVKLFLNFQFCYIENLLTICYKWNLLQMKIFH